MPYAAKDYAKLIGMSGFSETLLVPLKGDQEDIFIKTESLNRSSCTYR